MALKDVLKKDNTNESETFTDPVLHHICEIIMNADKSKESFRTEQTILECLAKWKQSGHAWVFDKV